MSMRHLHCAACALLLCLTTVAVGAEPVPVPTAAWVAQNQAIQAKIARLDRTAPGVGRDLPLVEARIAGIFTELASAWRDDTPIHQAIAAMIHGPLDALGAGQDAYAWCRGRRVDIPYRSETTGTVLVASVDVPTGYEPGREHQLFLSYKGRPPVESAVRTGTFFACGEVMIQAKGRFGVLAEAEELVALLVREFPGISADRVFLTGFSDGGYTAFFVASRAPHLFAGIAPMVANWQWGNVENWGLLNVPTLILEGTMDAGYVHENTNRWHMLVSHGCDLEMWIGAFGHTKIFWDEPNSEDAPAGITYQGPPLLPQVTAWTATKRRDLWPRRVRYATWNLNWNRAYWVSIRRMIDPRFAADVDVRVAGDTVTVHANNIAQLRLTLSDRLLDPGKAVNIVTDTGRSLYAGPYREEIDVVLYALPDSPFAKSPDNPGDINVMAERASYLVGNWANRGVAAEKRITILGTTVSGDEAKLLGQATFFGQRDTDVDEPTLAVNNLHLVGTPAQNAVLRRIADQLPVRFEPGRFLVGERVFDRPGQGVSFVHPSPFNPRKHIIVTAYNDIASAAARTFPRPRFGEFNEGDLILFDSSVDAGAPVEQERLVFDTHWRVPAREVLRTLDRPMAYPDYLQLMAKALKEGTGAEVGLVCGAPSWFRWRTGLRDAITVEDVATMDGVPDYVVMCELPGQKVLELRPPWCQSTVLPGRDHPAWEEGLTLTVEQIDPKRWYRVAVNYWVTDTTFISFTDFRNRTDFPLLRLRSPADYERHSERIRLLSRGMMLSDRQSQQLVVDYLRKRRGVAP